MLKKVIMSWAYSTESFRRARSIIIIIFLTVYTEIDAMVQYSCGLVSGGYLR